jgi:S-formylglutathione hydrolase
MFDSSTARPPRRPRSFALAALLLASCLSLPRSAPASLSVERIPAPCLEGDLMENPDTITAAVYLPPSYAASPGRRYPTLYLLHGIDGDYRDWTEPGYHGFRIEASMDSLIGAGAVREMIVVVPTGRGKGFMGAFYANSPVQGNWEDCIARDLVGWVDRTYRTLAAPTARGLAGHSMGGFGAITLGMRHPNLFGTVYAMSPCCLGIEKDIAPGNSAWNEVLAMRGWADYERAEREENFYPPAILSLLSAFTPDPSRPPFYAALPYRMKSGRLVAAEKTYSRYRASFPLYAVDRYADNLRRLRGLVMDFGPSDEFTHIPPTTTAFSQELAKRGIAHRLEVYEGDHRNRMRERMNAIVLPYFSRMLAEGDRSATRDASR